MNEDGKKLQGEQDINVGQRLIGTTSHELEVANSLVVLREEEELSQFLVVDGIEDTKREDFHPIDFIRRVVPTTTNNTRYWEDTRICR